MTEQIERAIESDGLSNDKKLIIAIAVIILVFGSFFAFRYYQSLTAQVITIDDLHQKNLENDLNEEQGYVYNGFSFVFFDGLWYTKIQRGTVAYEIPLHYGPKDLEGVTKRGALSENFNIGTDIYITFNPLSENLGTVALATSELAQNIVTAIKRRPIGACDRNETDSCSDRPIITCDTTTQATIYLLQEPGPEIEFNDNCIILRGIQDDLIKVVDRLLLEWYGVIA